jgi:hypothetical protein
LAWLDEVSAAERVARIEQIAIVADIDGRK